MDDVGLSGRMTSRDGEVDAAEAVDAPERPITSQQRDGSHGRLPVGVGCRVGAALLAVLPEGADEEPASLLLARSPLFGRPGHWWASCSTDDFGMAGVTQQNVILLFTCLPAMSRDSPLVGAEAAEHAVDFHHCHSLAKITWADTGKLLKLVAVANASLQQLNNFAFKRCRP